MLLESSQPDAVTLQRPTERIYIHHEVLCCHVCLARRLHLLVLRALVGLRLKQWLSASLLLAMSTVPDVR